MWPRANQTPLSACNISKKRQISWRQIKYNGEVKEYRCPGTSLVAPWLRIRLPRQGTWLRALVWEDPTCCRATKPVHHNYWACALEPMSHNYWARAPHLLKPLRLEPILRNKRSHHSEKPAHCNRVAPPTATRESLRAATKTQHSQKKKEYRCPSVLKLIKFPQIPENHLIAYQTLGMQALPGSQRISLP